MVFPTHVGVFLGLSRCKSSLSCLPHARGGVSDLLHALIRHTKSSPRTWGCFRSESVCISDCGVFPTHVGVFLAALMVARCNPSLPHARGGVSKKERTRGMRSWSSPRTWGCFCAVRAGPGGLWVFPTHVGVFLETWGRCDGVMRLPHARGGVSTDSYLGANVVVSSPRTWGCFRHAMYQAPCCCVFPTHVGVFPNRTRNTGMRICLPHARGGVSSLSEAIKALPPSSPRTWGCFSHQRPAPHGQLVFPTHVGVFLTRPCASRTGACLPHARGGVS